MPQEEPDAERRCAGHGAARGGTAMSPAAQRIGRVTGIRYGEDTNEPEPLEVRAGLL
jgi:hypothetical protein